MTSYWDCNFFTFFVVLGRRILSLFQGDFQQIASDEVQLLVLSAVAISSGIISPFLVLKRLAMLANSLSHTILLGIAISALSAKWLWGGQWFDVPTLLLGALLAAALTAFCTETLIRWFRLPEDASIGLVFTGLFALGITFVNIYLRSAHLGVEAIMGNVDALQLRDIRLPALFIGINALAVILFFKQLQVISFDQQLAKTLGFNVGFFRYLFLFLISATCIGAFRSVGVILVLSFLTGPYLTARLFSNRLNHLLVWTPALGLFASLIGVALSRHLFNVHGWALSTGGIVSMVIGILYLIAKGLAYLRRAKLNSSHRPSNMVSSESVIPGKDL